MWNLSFPAKTFQAILQIKLLLSVLCSGLPVVICFVNWCSVTYGAVWLRAGGIDHTTAVRTTRQMDWTELVPEGMLGVDGEASLKSNSASLSTLLSFSRRKGCLRRARLRKERGKFWAGRISLLPRRCWSRWHGSESYLGRGSGWRCEGSQGQYTTGNELRAVCMNLKAKPENHLYMEEHLAQKTKG